jgi:hypothetical protein
MEIGPIGIDVRKDVHVVEKSSPENQAEKASKQNTDEMQLPVFPTE